jgi:hypothetical protein
VSRPRDHETEPVGWRAKARAVLKNHYRAVVSVADEILGLRPNRHSHSYDDSSYEAFNTSHRFYPGPILRHSHSNQLLSPFAVNPKNRILIALLKKPGKVTGSS